MKLYAALVVVLVTASAQAGLITTATFEDPAQDASTPMFTYHAGTGVLSGCWLDEGLTLETASGRFPNVTFIMSALPGSQRGETGFGRIDFYDERDTSIFTIEFDTGHFAPFAFGATEFLASDVVVFSGPILSGPVNTESFGFLFANQTPIGDDGSFSATAAFTASATPEPAVLVMVLTGSVVFLRRRR